MDDDVNGSLRMVIQAIEVHSTNRAERLAGLFINLFNSDEFHEFVDDKRRTVMEELSVLENVLNNSVIDGLHAMRRLVTEAHVHFWLDSTTLSEFKLSGSSLYYLLADASSVLENDRLSTREKITELWDGMQRQSDQCEDEKTARNNLEKFLDQWRASTKVPDKLNAERRIREDFETGWKLHRSSLETFFDSLRRDFSELRSKLESGQQEIAAGERKVEKRTKAAEKFLSGPLGKPAVVLIFARKKISEDKKKCQRIILEAKRDAEEGIKPVCSSLQQLLLKSRQIACDIALENVGRYEGLANTIRNKMLEAGHLTYDVRFEAQWSLSQRSVKSSYDILWKFCNFLMQYQPAATNTPPISLPQREPVKSSSLQQQQQQTDRVPQKDGIPTMTDNQTKANIDDDGLWKMKEFQALITLLLAHHIWPVDYNDENLRTYCEAALRSRAAFSAFRSAIMEVSNHCWRAAALQYVPQPTANMLRDAEVRFERVTIQLTEVRPDLEDLDSNAMADRQQVPGVFAQPRDNKKLNAVSPTTSFFKLVSDILNKCSYFLARSAHPDFEMTLNKTMSEKVEAVATIDNDQSLKAEAQQRQQQQQLQMQQEEFQRWLAQLIQTSASSDENFEACVSDEVLNKQLGFALSSSQNYQTFVSAIDSMCSSLCSTQKHEFLPKSTVDMFRGAREKLATILTPHTSDTMAAPDVENKGKCDVSLEEIKQRQSSTDSRVVQLLEETVNSLPGELERTREAVRKEKSVIDSLTKKLHQLQCLAETTTVTSTPEHHRQQLIVTLVKKFCLSVLPQGLLEYQTLQVRDTGAAVELLYREFCELKVQIDHFVSENEARRSEITNHEKQLERRLDWLMHESPLLLSEIARENRDRFSLIIEALAEFYSELERISSSTRAEYLLPQFEELRQQTKSCCDFVRGWTHECRSKIVNEYFSGIVDPGRSNRYDLESAHQLKYDVQYVALDLKKLQWEYSQKMRKAHKKTAPAKATAEEVVDSIDKTLHNKVEHAIVDRAGERFINRKDPTWYPRVEQSMFDYIGGRSNDDDIKLLVDGERLEEDRIEIAKQLMRFTTRARDRVSKYKHVVLNKDGVISETKRLWAFAKALLLDDQEEVRLHSELLGKTLNSALLTGDNIAPVISMGRLPDGSRQLKMKFLLAGGGEVDRIDELVRSVAKVGGGLLRVENTRASGVEKFNERQFEVTFDGATGNRVKEFVNDLVAKMAELAELHVRVAMMGEFDINSGSKLTNPAFNRIYGRHYRAAGFRTTEFGYLIYSGEKYFCPTGWRRISIHVASSVEEFDRRYGGWHVAYHGTTHELAATILTSGFIPLVDKNSKGEEVIYFSPSIEYAGHPRYSKTYEVAGKDGRKKFMQMVLLVRVNPERIWKKIGGTLPGAMTPAVRGFDRERDGTPCDPNFPDNENLEWIVKPLPGKIGVDQFSDVFVIYGIMIRSSETDLAEMPQNAWWKKINDI